MTLRAIQSFTFSQTNLLLKKVYSPLALSEENLKIAEKVHEAFYLPELAWLSEEPVDWTLFEISELTGYFDHALPLLLSLVLTGHEQDLKKAYLFLTYGPKIQFNEDWQLCTSLPLLAFQLSCTHENLLQTLTIEKPIQISDEALSFFGFKCSLDMAAVQSLLLENRTFFDHYTTFLSLILKIYEPDMSHLSHIQREYFIMLGKRALFSPITLLKCRIFECLSQEVLGHTALFDLILERLRIISEGFSEGISSIIELKLPGIESELEALIQMVRELPEEKALFLTANRGQLLEDIAKTNQKSAQLVKELLQFMPIPNFNEFEQIDNRNEMSGVLVDLDGSPTSANLTKQWLNLSYEDET